MNEEAMKKHLEQYEKRLQLLEDQISGIPSTPTEGENLKEQQIDEFINQMKAINPPAKPDGGSEEDDFIKLLSNINK